jgi:anthraniloyl-CoA monooxygenase
MRNGIIIILFYLGDAKATAHYSIGSGTKLAMDCAIGLSDAVIANPNDVQAAFQQYDKTRRNTVEMIQYAALVSLDWFENMDRHNATSVLTICFWMYDPF